MSNYNKRMEKRLHKAKVFLFIQQIERTGTACISNQKIKIFSIVGGTVLFNYIRHPLPSPGGGGLSTGVENLDGYPKA